MRLPSDALVEFFLARLTLEPFRLAVYPHVLLQRLLARKRFRADPALEGPLFRVFRLVFKVIGLCREFDCARGAFVARIRVHRDEMLTIDLRVGKLRVTLVTLLHFSVHTVYREHVIRFHLLRHQSLAAYRADVPPAGRRLQNVVPS